MPKSSSIRCSDFISIMKYSLRYPRSIIKKLCLFLFGLLILENNFLLASADVTFHEQDLQGEVEAGNYTYYHLKNDFNNGNTKTAAVVLLLFSVEGDADLYVSRTIDKPTYEHGQHDFQSTTCGIDRLDINLNAPIYSDSGSIKRGQSKKPLTVGVYGHPSQPLTRYLLKVLLFMDDKPILGSQSDDWKLTDDDYMSDEMLILHHADRWREWVQQVQVVDNDLANFVDPAIFSDSATHGPTNGEGFGQLMKSIAEILLAILSFALNVLVEVMA